MEPHEVYSGPVCNRIKIKDDCWLWQGSMEYGPTWRGEAIRSVAARHAGLPVIHGVQYAVACEKPRCVHPLHVVTPGSEVGRMLYVKQRTKKRYACRLWQGPVRNGRPLMPAYREDGSRTTVSVSMFVYTVEYNHRPSDPSSVTTKCGKKLCVEPTHLVVKEAETHDVTV